MLHEQYRNAREQPPENRILRRATLQASDAKIQRPCHGGRIECVVADRRPLRGSEAIEQRSAISQVAAAFEQAGYSKYRQRRGKDAGDADQLRRKVMDS